MTFAILHGSAGGSLLTSWRADPPLVLALLLAAGLYHLGVLRLGLRRGRTWPRVHALRFYGGLLALAVALLGPLDTFNDDLFAMHMLQHLTLILVAAPLLLAGRPAQLALQALPPRYSRALVRRLFAGRRVRRGLHHLLHPLVALVLFNASMAIWHTPALYEAAIRDQTVHELEHASFVATALLFWWLLIDPVPRHHRVAPHWAVGMLFVSASVGDLISLPFLLAPYVIYADYLGRGAPWGISSLTDQRLAGLAMLVGGSAGFFGALFFTIARGAAIGQPVDEAGPPSEAASAEPESAGHHLPGSAQVPLR